MSPLELTIPEILDIKNIKAEWSSPVQPPLQKISHISTDSRTIKKGQIFTAICGEQFDGHDFIQKAVDADAMAVIAEKSWYEKNKKKFKNSSFIVVPDTLQTYQEIAKNYRKKFIVPLIALSGSAGKTTTKELLFAVMSQKYNTLRNDKSFNNHIGVPATLLNIRAEHEIVLTELGTNHFGELTRLSSLVSPNLCLLLNIGHAHLEFFKNLAGVTRAKMEIFDHVSNDGTGVYNADDPNLAKQYYPVSTLVSYGVKNSADVTAKILHSDDQGCYSFEFMDQVIKLQIPGRHNVSNALAAATVGLQFGVSPVEIKNALENVPAFEKRMQVSQVRDFTVLNDSYNSNPSSCYAALETVNDMSQSKKGRKIAVLGDMLELGEFSAEEHEKLAEHIVEFKFDMVFLYGNETSFTYEKLINKIPYAEHFENKEMLSKALLQTIKQQDIVLVKGSRGMRMESVVQDLINS